MIQPFKGSLASRESTFRPVGSPLGWTARDVFVRLHVMWSLVQVPLSDLLPLQLGRPYRTLWFRQCKSGVPLVNLALTELLRLVRQPARRTSHLQRR